MQKRPGGLTALAVLNFVFGGIGVIASLLGFGALAVIKEAMQQAQEQGVAYTGQSLTMAYVGVGATAIAAVLLIISGVGYLKQSPFAGRGLGTLYALVSLGGTVLSIATGGGIGLLAVVFAVYPLLTLILLNTSFKPAFARA
jgi:hypothetical protein